MRDRNSQLYHEEGSNKKKITLGSSDLWENTLTGTLIIEHTDSTNKGMKNKLRTLQISPRPEDPLPSL